MTTRRVIISAHGGPDVLKIVEGEVPEPGPGEARVRVRASGVAFGDVLKRVGLAGGPKPSTGKFTPGYDLAGVIEKVGPGVQGFKQGDRVAAFVLNGGNAEHACVPAEWLARIPDGVDFVDALCCVLNYVTAWQMIHRVCELQRGQRLLVHGAGGGVGTALLQLGGLAGLERYGTASTGKHGLVRQLGATPIDYRSVDFVVRVRELTGGAGVDAVFDPIGGMHLHRSFRALKRGGWLVAYGISAAVTGGRRQLAPTAAWLLWYMLRPGVKTRFYGIGASKTSNPTTIHEDLVRVLQLLGEKKIKPVVGAQLQLEDAVEAHRMIERGAVAGKIVLVS